MQEGINKLLDQFRFQFEGLSKPVFYYDLYPTSYFYDDMKPHDWQRYRFIQGLKVDKKMELEKRKNLIQYFTENMQLYLQILRKVIYIFDDKYRVGVLTIPSSTKGYKNVVTKMVQKAVQNSSGQVKDLTSSLVRIKDKEPGHLKDGNRDSQMNIETLKFEYSDLQNIDILIVIDDVVTSGFSFRAVNNIIENQGFKGVIINFAFARSMNQVGFENYDMWDKQNRINEYEKNKNIGNIRGLIFDFDQTLIDSSYKNEEFENRLSVLPEKLRWKFVENINSPYELYEGIDEIINLKIPFAIVSNSRRLRLRMLTQLENIQNILYPEVKKLREFMHVTNRDIQMYNLLWKKDTDINGRMRNGSIWRYIKEGAKNIFPTPIHYLDFNNENNYIMYPKPHEKGVLNAIDFLQSNFQIENGERILGVGNTLEDIIAYHKAGIEAALALWGVPKIACEYARNSWGADYVFDTPKDMKAFLVQQNSF